jgi:flagellar protein FlaG
MMLITGVVAAAILIVAVLPVVWSMVGTFSTASAQTDTRMRTDFKIVATYACGSPTCLAGTRFFERVWVKNIGSSRIGLAEVNQSDVLIGLTTNFNRATYDQTCVLSNLEWCYVISETPSPNGYWDPGETIQIYAYSTVITGPSLPVYFQFILPNSVSRTEEFSST